MLLEDAICKLVTIISGKGLIDIAVIEPEAHIFPILMEIDYQHMPVTEGTKIDFSQILKMLEGFLELNAIQGGLDIDIHSLENRDIMSLKMFLLKIFAVFYVFSPENFAIFVTRMEEDEFPELLLQVNKLSGWLKDEMTHLYTRVSIDEKAYLNSLIKKVKSYEHEVKDLNEHIAKLQDQLNSVGYEIKDLFKTISVKNDEIKTLTLIKDATIRENDNINVTNIALQNNLDKITEQNNELAKKYATLDEEYAKLNNIISEYKETLNTYRFQFETFKAREKLFEDALQKLSVYEEKVKNYDKLLSENQELKNFITLLHSRNKKLQEQVSVEIDKIMDLRKTVKKLEKENYHSAAETNLLENVIKNLKNELKIYKSNTRNNLINNYIDDMHNMNESKVTQKNDNPSIKDGEPGLVRQTSVASLYMDKINVLNKEITDLKEKLRQAGGPMTKEQRDEEIDCLLKELDAMNQRINELRDTKDNLEIDLADLKKENEELKNEVTKMRFKTSSRTIQRFETMKKEDAETLKKKIEVKDAMIDDLNSQVELLNRLVIQKDPKDHEKHLMDVIAVKNTEIEDLKNKLNTQQTTYNSRSKSVDANSQANIPLPSEIEQRNKILQLQREKQEVISESKKSLRNLTKTFDVRDSLPYKKLEEVYNKLKKDHEILLEEVSELKLMIKSLEALDIDIEKVKKELNDKKVEIKQLRTAQQAIKRENDDLKYQVDTKDTEIESLIQRLKNPKDSVRLDFDPKKLSNTSNMSLANNFMSRDALLDDHKETVVAGASTAGRKDYRSYDDYNILYSVFMDYTRKYLDVETQRKERNAELKSNLTNGFSLGKLLI